MKNEKLELMLNKVVEYNRPKAGNNKYDACHFKAFLYKDSEGYYFKIVEIIVGDGIVFDQIIRLEKRDAKFLSIAVKPKLMQISKQSWHYRLLQYVLKSEAPTPRDMQNGCPYFWLVVFSVIVVPFIELFKAVRWLFMLIPNFIHYVVELMINNWILGLDDAIAFDMKHNGWGYSDIKMPKAAKTFFDKTDNDFMEMFLSKKYNLKYGDEGYTEKMNELELTWKRWGNEVNEKKEAARKENSAKVNEKYKRTQELKRKREESRQAWEAKMKPFRTWKNNKLKKVKDTFTLERGKRNTIIKRTQQFVGGVVTIGLLFLSYIVVSLIARGVTSVIDVMVNGGWMYLVATAVIAVGVGIIWVLLYLINYVGENIINKYKQGKKIWYVEPFIYLIWYPIKYTALAFVYVVVKVFWVGIRFIFYTVMYEHFIRPVGTFIGYALKAIFKGILGSTGIFGEYFGASYSDYCPGLEWKDFDDEDMKIQ